jgi:hypothetical protein
LNRSGEPEAELNLDSREFTYYPRSSDDSQTMLTLRWINPTLEYGFPALIETPDWFDQSKLKELGFDVSVLADSPAAAEYYSNSEERELFVALELAGPALEKWLHYREAFDEAQYARSPGNLQRPQGVDAGRLVTSRLVAIDVGRDPRALRSKYPNRQQVMIVAGIARVARDEAVRASPGQLPRPGRLRGRILSLSNESIYVTREFREQLNALASQTPSYFVTLRVGSRYEPWIVNLKKR